MADVEKYQIRPGKEARRTPISRADATVVGRPPDIVSLKVAATQCQADGLASVVVIDHEQPMAGRLRGLFCFRGAPPVIPRRWRLDRAREVRILNSLPLPRPAQAASLDRPVCASRQGFFTSVQTDAEPALRPWWWRGPPARTARRRAGRACTGAMADPDAGVPKPSKPLDHRRAGLSARCGRVPRCTLAELVKQVVRPPGASRTGSAINQKQRFRRRIEARMSMLMVLGAQ